MKHPIRKRSYLLLEIVISLMLITLCLFPLIKPHLAIKKSHAFYLKEIKSYPLFQNAFCEIKEKLYAQEFSWKDLIAGVEGEIDPNNLKDRLGIDLTPIKYTIKEVKSCKKPSLGGRGLLINVKLSIDKMEQVHTLFIEEVLR